jgi:hypothetical protein
MPARLALRSPARRRRRGKANPSGGPMSSAGAQSRRRQGPRQVSGRGRAVAASCSTATRPPLSNSSTGCWRPSRSQF